MSSIRRALQGFSYGWNAGEKVGSLLARRRGYAAGWAARAILDKERVLRATRLRRLGGSARQVAGWIGVLAAIGALVLTTTRGDEIAQMLTGGRSA
jgi:hypothetical protein